MASQYPPRRISQTSQFPWSQDPNSAFQASYSEVIKGAEDLLKQQQIFPEVKDFYNPAAKENKEHLTKTIDKCHNDPKYLQIQVGIDLMSTARHVLQDQTYTLHTDGRRIVADKNSVIQKSRDEESLQLLKKIADMELDDFPSDITEEIKDTWKAWNSPEPSPESLHLDEIETLNLDNIQEG
ncbi:hypothetical protein CXB51_024273 [Gossypium anomalum]|uniref:Uncharacterized protein n=1 Tax=Gossypium anomalum TaxID=47600 RepID=A0A8J6CPG8_9ROSI|nr:hypothetical protein CXB51_024273 [Gossypium anomalum]